MIVETRYTTGTDDEGESPRLSPRWIICSPTKTGTQSLEATLTKRSVVAQMIRPRHRMDPWDCYPNVELVVMLRRNPLSRFVSMYNHYVRQPYWTHNDEPIVDTLEQYAAEFFMRRAMYRDTDTNTWRRKADRGAVDYKYSDCIWTETCYEQFIRLTHSCVNAAHTAAISWDTTDLANLLKSLVTCFPDLADRIPKLSHTGKSTENFARDQVISLESAKRIAKWCQIDEIAFDYDPAAIEGSFAYHGIKIR